MNLVNKVELKLENYDKCSLICDNDAPLGSLYDFSCALRQFFFEKLKSAEEAQVKENQKVIVEEQI